MSAYVDETCLDRFKAGYADVFVKHHAKKFDWTAEFTIRVTRDAVRFLSLSSVRPSGVDESDVRVMVSSPIVDRIVDAIFLDTPLLVWLEELFDVPRLVHIPSYAHSVAEVALTNVQYDFTIMLMQAAGYHVDYNIWPSRLPINYKSCWSSNDLEDCKVMSLRR